MVFDLRQSLSGLLRLAASPFQPRPLTPDEIAGIHSSSASDLERKIAKIQEPFDAVIYAALMMTAGHRTSPAMHVIDRHYDYAFLTFLQRRLVTAEKELGQTDSTGGLRQSYAAMLEQIADRLAQDYGDLIANPARLDVRIPPEMRLAIFGLPDQSPPHRAPA